MIVFDEKQKVFFLNGKNYTYAMAVNECGFLQHSYYGAKIERCDGEYLRFIGSFKEPRVGNLNMDEDFHRMPSECGFYAHGDFREPTVIIENEDGALTSRFRYVGYEYKKGCDKIEGMPCVRKADETLTIILKDDFSNAEISLIYSVSDDSDVLVRSLNVRNLGNEKIRLKKAFSFCVDLDGGEYSALRLSGRWAQERMEEVAPLAHGITKIQSLRGISSHHTNPFLGILKGDCGESFGECFGVQLCYSGSFAVTAEYEKVSSLRIQGGINDTAFSWTLNGGEKFVTPQAFLAYSNEGLGSLSRSYADFLREKVIRPDLAYKKRPIVINNWEATYFDFTSEKLFSIIDGAKGLGIDTFVLDDGWFGKRNSDETSLGDWFVNEEKLKGGIKEISRYCQKNGLKFGIWIEPEMISEDSELYRTHPDYAIQKEGVEPCRIRNQLVLDLTRKEVVDYIYSVIAKLIIENEISYVKWDMNRCLTELYSKDLGSEKQGEFSHRYMLGVYSLMERLTETFKEVFFEACSAGGARYDAGILYYFSQIWTSDDTDAYERTKIQWGTSYCYPVSSMSCHVSASPNHQTGRAISLKTRGAIASLGAFGYELDVTKLTKEERESVKEQIKEYERIADLVLSGDLYRLSSPFNKDHFAQMIVSKDKSTAYLVVERFLGAKEFDFVRNLKLDGLAEEKIYKIEELNVTASGSALKNVGVVLPKLLDFESVAWHIAEVK